MADALNLTGHMLVSGQTGSGKTNFFNQEILARVEEGWVTVVYPHPDPGYQLIAELYARYGETLLDRLIVEKLSDMDRVVMRRFIRVSKAVDPLVELQENDDYCNAFMDILARRRGLSDFAETPVLEKYTKDAIKIAQNQDTYVSESFLPEILIPSSPAWAHYHAHCTDDTLKMEMESWKQMGPKDRLTNLQPAYRLLCSILKNPQVMARTSRVPSHDKAKAMNDGCIRIFLGGNVSDDALRVIVGSDFQDTMYLLKSGEVTNPGTYGMDEINNYHLVGHFESRAASTIRAFGGGTKLIFVSQSNDFPTPEIAANMMQNSPTHVVFRQGDKQNAEMWAGDMMGALDEYKVHHQTKRQVHGGFEFHERVTETTGDRGESKSVSLTPIARYEEYREDVYQSGHEQLLWLQKRLLMLPVGTCWIKTVGQVPFEHRVSLMEDSWVFPGDPSIGLPPLATDKVQECLRLLKQRPPYEAPEMPRLPQRRTSTRMGRNATAAS